MQCETLADDLPGVIDGTDGLGERATAHIETCLRCQAELVQYRRLSRTLRSLRNRNLLPNDGLLDDILSVIDDPSSAPHTTRAARRTAYLSGLAAATAAGAAGAIVIASRARSRRLVG